MQDWMYIVGDTYELTLEISESKHPPESYIRQVWEENRAAMVKYPLLVAYGGIYGRLREGDPEGGPARPATEAVVAIEGNPKLSRPGKQGQFFRPVVPGARAQRSRPAAPPCARFGTEGRGWVSRVSTLSSPVRRDVRCRDLHGVLLLGLARDVLDHRDRGEGQARVPRRDVGPLQGRRSVQRGDGWGASNRGVRVVVTGEPASL